ncbi:MAG: M1 family aminopeptidase, partial [Pyrinomonadaceae bacterium]
GVTLRVQLREAVAAGSAAEIDIAFKGTLPEIDPDETSLSAHVVQQVGAAQRDTREWRRARDTNFYSRGVMLLGAFYPVLAVRDGDEWQRKVEPSVGDALYAETADYEVTITAPHDVALFTSGAERGGRAGGGDTTSTVVERDFGGEGLRSFAVIAGRSLRSQERAVSGVRVRSVYTAEHEAVGRRVLGVAAEAVRIFVARFGELPFKTITVTEAPLVAGLGSAEYTGLGVIASAFYVDFDAPATRNLPEIVREQRASVEDSLEFTVAHVVAHQWWGGAVGNDPARAPVLDEALAHWSALLYYKEARGEEHAAQALDDQLRGVYQIYRTFGGDDMAADRAAREYRNSFQYAAIVAGKGALMFPALREQMGEERFWTAVRRYYEANRFEIAEINDLEAAFVAEVPVGERRRLTRAFDRWLTEKRGDQDVAPPNPQLAAALGLTTEQPGPKDRNAFSRLGRFFWRQMTRIR